jgi:hypothetical protein
VLIEVERTTGINKTVQNTAKLHLPRCPDCGSPVNLLQLGRRVAAIDGATVLFYCSEEMACGWSETSGLPHRLCVDYYVRAIRKSEVIDLSRIKIPLTPDTR